MAELTCGKCGNTNPGDATFCGTCGASLVAQRQAKTGERKPGVLESDRQPGAAERTTYRGPKSKEFKSAQPWERSDAPQQEQYQPPPQDQYQPPAQEYYQQPGQQPAGHAPQYAPSYAAPTAEPVSTGEMLGWGCLGFLIPIVGLILPVIWMAKKRPNAVGCLVAGIIYIVLGAVFGFLMFIGAMAESGY